MSDAISVQIAKGCRDHIAGADFASGAIVERSYAEWDMNLAGSQEAWELKDADKLHIDVVAHTTEQEHQLSARGRLQFDCPIDIAVRKRLSFQEQDAASGLLNPDEIDSLVKLTEDLHVLFTASRLPDLNCAVWHPQKGTRVLVCPMREHLRELRQFTSIVRVTFRADMKLEVEG